MDIYDKIATVMYDAWACSVPYTRNKWTINDSNFDLPSQGHFFSNTYMAGSKVQLMDFFGQVTNDADSLNELGRILVLTDTDPKLDANNKALFKLESPPGIHHGYYRLKLLTELSTTLDLLHVESELHPADVKDDLIEDGYLSNKAMKKIFEDMLQITGLLSDANMEANAKPCPAVTIYTDHCDHTDIDIVLCLRCDGWPAVINSEFRNRNRPSGWPSTDLLGKALDQPCHVVAVGYYESPTKHLEWRLSCTMAETMLMQSLSPVQHAVLVITKKMIKGLLDDYHQKEGKPDHSITTFHIKTLFQWECEIRDPQSWHRENILIIIMGLVNQMIENLTDLKLRHYFLPQNNLFAHLSPQYAFDFANFLQHVHYKIIASVAYRALGMELANIHLYSPEECYAVKNILFLGTQAQLESLHLKWVNDLPKIIAFVENFAKCHIDEVLLRLIRSHYDTNKSADVVNQTGRKWISFLAQAGVHVDDRLVQAHRAFALQLAKFVSRGAHASLLDVRRVFADLNRPPTDIDHIELYTHSISMLINVLVGENKDHLLMDLTTIIDLALRADHDYIFQTYISLSEYEPMGLSYSETIPASRLHAIMFEKLLPFQLKADTHIAIPPVHPVMWLQYLCIICAAEKMDETAHGQVTVEVEKLLRISECQSKYNALQPDRHETHTAMTTGVMIFYCIRCFCMNSLKGEYQIVLKLCM